MIESDYALKQVNILALRNPPSRAECQSATPALSGETPQAIKVLLRSNWIFTRPTLH